MSCTFLAGIDTVRVTRLDQCGRPICAADSSFVTSCVANLNLTANIDDGAEIEYRNGRGDLCSLLQRCPTFRNFSAELEVLFASPELIDIVTNSNTVHDYAGKVVGFDTGNVTCQPFALEAWINTIADECEPGVQGEWLYILLPYITGGVLGDLEIGSEATNFTLTGNTRGGGSWGLGPFSVVDQTAPNTPGPLLTPLDSKDHRRIQLTNVPPPVPSCEYVPVVCASS